jgi:hypothetical protein
MCRFFLALALVPVLSAESWVRHVVAQGFQSNATTAADFTGDKRIDIVANDADKQRDILFAAPDWKPVTLREKAEGIFAAAALDMDGDGDSDYVAARYSPGLLYWLERPRDPLTEPWKYHVIDDSKSGGIDGIHGLAIGRINRDGRPDIVANSAQPKGAFPNSIAWYAAPKWERRIFADKDAPGLSHYMGIGDVNSDGRPDIASAAKIAEGGNWFAWWEQPADLAKPWRKHLVAQGQEGASNIVMADVNRDGKTDFIASRGHGKGLVWFQGPDWKPHDIDARHVYPHSLAIGDIDGDGDIDAVTCSAVYDGSKPTGVAWFENDGKGRFKTHLIAAGQASYDTHLVDIDGDGDLDVLVAGQESRNVVWFENRLKK